MSILGKYLYKCGFEGKIALKIVVFAIISVCDFCEVGVTKNATSSTFFNILAKTLKIAWKHCWDLKLLLCFLKNFHAPGHALFPTTVRTGLQKSQTEIIAKNHNF